MPVMLMTLDDVAQWLRGGSVDDALKMQKPAPDNAIVIRSEEKSALGNVHTNACAAALTQFSFMLALEYDRPAFCGPR